jgi:hypothetical protein
LNCPRAAPSLGEHLGELLAGRRRVPLLRLAADFATSKQRSRGSAGSEGWEGAVPRWPPLSAFGIDRAVGKAVPGRARGARGRARGAVGRAGLIPSAFPLLAASFLAGSVLAAAERIHQIRPKSPNSALLLSGSNPFRFTGGCPRSLPFPPSASRPCFADTVAC